MTASVVYMNGAPVTFRSSTQKMVSLLTNNAELKPAVVGVQDALFVKKHNEITWTESQITCIG